LSEPFGPVALAARLDVSRETMARLEAYAALLVKWQQTLNLVSYGSMTQLWCRHMLDSAQLAQHFPRAAERLVDLGSGAGFPGLVLAAMGVPEVHLVEADGRKCAFLREVARRLELAVTVHHCRLETLELAAVDVITARALAPLPKLLDMAYHFIEPSTCCMFLKGAQLDGEIEAAMRIWRFKFSRLPSLSDPRGSILMLNEVVRHGTLS
jgi:16S rRNA (guanine527-N7)-methyltransferase